MDEYESNLQHDKQLAHEYEKKIKKLFKEDKTNTKRKKNYIYFFYNCFR